MPSWDLLYTTAAAQAGYFTARQASEAGYSTALLRHYVRTGQDQHVRHGIYRLTKFPSTPHEELMIEWLWTGGVGVFSHETVLSLHELSDVLPTRFHLTVPLAWKRRRLRVPDGVELHYADLAATERARHDGVPVTTVYRALLDCARTHLAPDVLQQACDEARARSLILDDEYASIQRVI